MIEEGPRVAFRSRLRSQFRRIQIGGETRDVARRFLRGTGALDRFPLLVVVRGEMVTKSVRVSRCPSSHPITSPVAG
jgi:hypothetical protein